MGIIYKNFFNVTSPKFSYEYIGSRGYLGPVDLASDWIVHLWFENFLFTYESEYIVRNWTCLLGEIGGNFGIFLGGSILGLVDIVLAQMMTRMKS